MHPFIEHIMCRLPTSGTRPTQTTSLPRSWMQKLSIWLDATSMVSFSGPGRPNWVGNLTTAVWKPGTDSVGCKRWLMDGSRTCSITPMTKTPQNAASLSSASGCQSTPAMKVTCKLSYTFNLYVNWALHTIICVKYNAFIRCTAASSEARPRLLLEHGLSICFHWKMCPLQYHDSPSYSVAPRRWCWHLRCDRQARHLWREGTVRLYIRIRCNAFCIRFNKCSK